VVSVRLNSAGHLRCSKPCACCQAALRAAGVRRVVFHDGNDWGVCKL
jgi:tRNA(Arg) A34 adenosine deaminase TadA